MSALEQATGDGPASDVDPLAVALTLRVPVFERGTLPQAKAAAMEEFMLLSAYWQGELNLDRHLVLADAAPLQDEWDKLEGWESFRQGRTDSSVDAAKRVIREDLWDALQEKRRRVRALTNEIDRLERDASKVSRAYTMLSGG